ncbi:MAG: SDR family NAD(P)-dependent oxidoreductase [Caulobacteraceae bacterium]|nr:SDR family NAD(P)-dependent oxidoreductase [Caulobacteraceae bacterium]
MSTDLSPLAGRLALVTGASRGIGYASALALAKAGAHVIATARTQGGLEELDDEIFQATGEHATLAPFDLVDGGAIDRLGGAIFERWGKLDILLHAGGMLGPLTPMSHLEPREFDKVLAVNLKAPYRMIRSYEPLLLKSDAARAIFFTTSVAAGRAFWGPYATTKNGLEAMVRSWADEMESNALRATLVNPGKMRTRMRQQAYPGEDPETLPEPAEIGPLMVELANPDLSPPLEVDFQEWRQGPSVAALI